MVFREEASVQLMFRAGGFRFYGKGVGKMDALLELANVSKTVGKREILRNVTLRVGPGEIVGLVGPNGAGKSTLMKIAAGFSLPTVGNARINGRDVQKERPQALEKAAFLIEGPGLYNNLTGTQHLKMVCEERGVPYDPELVSDFVPFEKQLDGRVRTYSMGMKQRLALALCWAVRPNLFVLDEPTGALDPDGIFLLRKRIQASAESGAGVLISSHLLDEMAKTATRILFLRKGEIVWENAAVAGDELERIYQEKFASSDLGAES